MVFRDIRNRSSPWHLESFHFLNYANNCIKNMRLHSFSFIVRSYNNATKKSVVKRSDRLNPVF